MVVVLLCVTLAVADAVPIVRTGDAPVEGQYRLRICKGINWGVL